MRRGSAKSLRCPGCSVPFVGFPRAAVLVQRLRLHFRPASRANQHPAVGGVMHHAEQRRADHLALCASFDAGSRRLGHGSSVSDSSECPARGAARSASCMGCQPTEPQPRVSFGDRRHLPTEFDRWQAVLTGDSPCRLECRLMAATGLSSAPRCQALHCRAVACLGPSCP
jgi:hypothetical protein